MMKKIPLLAVALLFAATGAQAQNVGIGTTTPRTRLDVNGQATVKYLYVDPQDTTGEGGEFQLRSSRAAVPPVIIDNYYGTLRVFSPSTMPVLQAMPTVNAVGINAYPTPKYNLLVGGNTYTTTLKVGPVADTATAASSNASINLSATDKALQLNRVALTSSTDVTTVPNPVAGMQVFNTNTAADVEANYIYWWDGAKWVKPITSVQVGSVAPIQTQWGFSKPGYTWQTPSDTVQADSLYISPAFTVPASGWYSLRSRLFFWAEFRNAVGLPPYASPKGYAWVAVNNNDNRVAPANYPPVSATTPPYSAMDDGLIMDSRFGFGTNAVNVPASTFVYLNQGQNYYIKYVVKMETGDTRLTISNERSFYLSQFK